MTTSHGLGRKPSPPDERDYRLAAYLEPEGAVTSMFWQVGPANDQGQSGHCVGFGALDWGNCLPVDDNWANDEGHRLYYECKVIDGEPGAENGSYVRSAAKALKARGRLTAYAFGTLAEAKTFVLTKGPVDLGIDWLDGFFTPDADGLIHATGSIAGGHSILMYGADERYAYLQNSWGPLWGVNGNCRITWSDLATVFSSGGEAMAAVELPLAPAPVPPGPPAPPAPPTPTPDPKGCLTAALGLLTAIKFRSNKLKAAIAKLHELEGML